MCVSFCKEINVFFYISDIDVDKPDKKLVIMYLTSLYHGLREYSPQGGRKRRKLDVSFCFSFYGHFVVLSNLKSVLPQGSI